MVLQAKVVSGLYGIRRDHHGVTEDTEVFRVSQWDRGKSGDRHWGSEPKGESAFVVAGRVS